MKSSILDIVRETVYETLEDTLVDIVARAVAAEREACAQLADARGDDCDYAFKLLAARIRARR